MRTRERSSMQKNQKHPNIWILPNTKKFEINIRLCVLLLPNLNNNFNTRKSMLNILFIRFTGTGIYKNTVSNKIYHF